MNTLGAELGAVEPGRCEIRLAWREGLGQQHGYFHAGALATIADTAAGYAAYTLMPADSSVLSIEFKINLLRPADGELVIARAEVIRPGRRVSTCRADVFTEKGGAQKLCATALLSMMCLPGRADAPNERAAGLT
ncbi:MAG: PaaI family thioesterase [Gemmatimonadetes bacterium]|nr:PaaI family thioesterase [Gemmatimonadota bacterium]